MKSALHNMNPAAKFIVITICMLTMAFFFNPWTPLLMWIGVLFIQLLFSRIDWKLWILFMIPFFIMAFGYFWTTLVFAEDKSGPVVLSIWSINITEIQLNHALSISFRVLAFSGLSLLFALTTNPVSFILSLMQQLKLSPKIAYSILVGYQFLPVLKDEFVQIQQAHRLRGAMQAKSVFHRLFHMRKILLPMLAGAVRKAERAAFAMEARGFTGEKRKSFYKVFSVCRLDGYLVSLFMLLLVVSCMSALYMN
ncbi:energy-coupling factor transporter transmembrane component T family protein [Sporosarcina highlanderae]|uniref:Energy-coupling factor transporter transmembrane component T n=1 Tax=Sporosarcina highlanderae TaxID=3035916 RepID=A0ABT8JT61_9BACL|nr:energy-coupling factor transporter transmembrane component T [Sporosarcina highlanderae]MDN4608348.1 energy-coupling factor transporter transmembrane component T [Sporosarcina highlanderae]